MERDAERGQHAVDALRRSVHGAPGRIQDIGQFISALIYFLIFMAVVYFLIVVPYKHSEARRGVTVFGEPRPVKTCPACMAEDIPEAATKCRYCASQQPPAGAPA